MFNQFVLLLLGFLVLFVVAAPAPSTERETFDELRSMGMSEKGILALHNLAVKFKFEYAKVSRSKKATDKLMADFTIIGKKVVKEMTPEDQIVYNNYVEKYELS